MIHLIHHYTHTPIHRYTDTVATLWHLWLLCGCCRFSFASLSLLFRFSFASRTTRWDDPNADWIEADAPAHVFNGSHHLCTVLHSHSPEWLVICLGTNDLRTAIRVQSSKVRATASFIAQVRFIKYFSLYSVYVQCGGFAKLTLDSPRPLSSPRTASPSRWRRGHTFPTSASSSSCRPPWCSRRGRAS